MINKSISIIICLLLLLNMPVAFGAEPMVNVDANGTLITITGSTGQKYINYVSLIILKPGKTHGDLADSTNLQDEIIYQELKSTDNTGGFSFVVNAPREFFGNCEIIISCADMQTLLSEVYYIDPDIIYERLLNSSLSDVEGVLSMYSSPLKIKTDSNSLYALLTNKTPVLTLFAGAEYDDLAEIRNDFNNSVLSAAYSQASSNNISSVTGRSLEYLTYEGAGNYSALSDAQKNIIHSNILERSVASAHDADIAFEIGFLMQSLITRGYPGAIDVITDNAALLELTAELMRYQAFSSTKQPEIAKALAGRSFTTYKQLKTAFSDAMDEVQNSGNNTQSYPSYTGGGGGGSVATIREGTKIEYKQEPTIENIENGSQNKSIFNDVAETSWAFESINELYKAGIVNGTGDGNFLPDNPVTRAEFVKMLVMTLGVFDETAEAEFIDVSADDYFYKYIVSARKHGLVEGFSDGSFGASAYITREQLAVMLNRAIKIHLPDIQKAEMVSFNDMEEISDYALDSVYDIASIGLMNGVGNGMFDPAGISTRAMSAKVLYSVYTKLNK